MATAAATVKQNLAISPPPFKQSFLDPSGNIASAWQIWLSKVQVSANTSNPIVVTGDAQGTGNATNQITLDVETVQGKPIATVGFTGNYNDLIDTPPAASVDPGFANFVVPPLVAPAVSTANNVGLSGVQLPSGLAVLNNQLVTIPAVILTVPDNTLTNYWLNPAGSANPWTITYTPLDNYTIAQSYHNLINVWSIQSSGGSIQSVYMVGRTRPVIPRTTDYLRVADDIPQLYSIGIGSLYTPTAWSSGMALTFGQVFYTSTGQMYQSFSIVAGVGGTSAPTFTTPGTQAFGTVDIGYYGDYAYVGLSRYALNNGIEHYFSNIMATLYCDLQGTSGTQYSSVAKTYFQTLMKHVVTPWQASSSYSYGQKVIDGAGFIWLNITMGSHTTSGSNPFPGTPTINTVPYPNFNGTTQTDGGVTWLCIYKNYQATYGGGSPTYQQYMWLDTDETMYIYKYADSHDSYASTAFSLLWEYIKVTNDWHWLNTASPIPGQTYAALLQNIFYYNLAFLFNFLTPTFQGQVSPVDGSAYTINYGEDNCESSAGCQAAYEIFTLLGNTYYATFASGNVTDINGALSGMSNLNTNYFGWYYGDNLSWTANPTQLAWYPWWQAQFFPELNQCPFADDAFKEGVKQNVMKYWNNWPEDPGLTGGLPAAFLGYMAAKYWGDLEKAQAVVDIIETVFLSNGLIASDFGYYLQTKKLLTSPHRIRNVNGRKTTTTDPTGAAYTDNALRTITGANASELVSTNLDHVIHVNNTTSAAITIVLHTPTTDSFPLNIVDVAGNAATYNISIHYANGASTTVKITANNGALRLRYNLSLTGWFTE
jgi:hypothetical protein